MVPFDFNPHASDFQFGIDTIEEGYVAAVSGITQEINKKKAAFYDYNRHIERGGDPIEERDDDGRLIWTEDQVLNSTIAVAEEALMSLRKAYAVAIYHHWERSALRWTGKTNEKHDKLASLVTAMGYPIDPRLHAVRDLANLLKHANDRWGMQLYDSWREVFPAHQGKPVTTTWKVDWYEWVSLSEDHLKKIMAIIRASGPKNPLNTF